MEGWIDGQREARVRVRASKLEREKERENACKKEQASPKADRVSVHNLIVSMKAWKYRTQEG